ncbi:hypothetical protein DLH72_02900 [Candidatus Gracilibacteria bacterium]|nr:MAG: hypothetical protein DLH72_02900 [Candidatus Gracilibacteria bacterium]
MKKVLILRICSDGFKNLVKNGIKYKYREVKKFWEKRLLDSNGKPKDFDEIHIINGYKLNSPKAIIEFGGIEAIEEFEGKNCFKIKLGDILKIENYEDKNS